jgi:two-component system sensor histidine kinase VicK
MKSIKTKLILSYLFLTFSTITITQISVLLFFKRNEIIQNKNKILNKIIYAKNYITNTTLLESSKKINAFSSNYDDSVQVIILNVNNQKNTITTSQCENHIVDYIKKNIFHNKKFFFSKLKQNNKIITWCNYIEVFSNNNNKYIIFARTEVKSILQNISEMIFMIVFLFAISFILASYIAFLFAKNITVPIINLTNKAKEIANGNLNQKIIIKSYDEIGELTSSFNYMAQKLNHTMQKLLNENNKLEIILQNMTDGILYYNSSGNIIQYNNKAEKILGFDFKKKSFNYLLHKLNIKKNILLDKIIKPYKEIIEIDKKFFNINFIPYLNNNLELNKSILIILQDITKQKKINDMRKEFVANVSHEIQTPLTIIKAYTETILNDLDNNNNINTQKKFLEIINKEADRMSILAKDLLELSCFDNNQMNLNLKNINLVDIIKTSINQNIILANKKNQDIIFEEENKKIYVNCDANKINQVFVNIISNSIKYSDINSKIKIFFDESEEYYKVFIKDNGCGISKENLENIFERFYRVNKSRSREKDGTGLGLSIAQEIMRAHNGKIVVQSKLGVGTTMILYFKKNN